VDNQDSNCLGDVFFALQYIITIDRPRLQDAGDVHDFRFSPLIQGLSAQEKSRGGIEYIEVYNTICRGT
jgi:hypothetical protein